MAPRIELFAFRYRDRRTGKWMRARYVATREEIEARHAEWEITGPAEIRDVDPEARAFSPFAPHRGHPVRNLGPVLAIAESRRREPRRVAIAGIAT